MPDQANDPKLKSAFPNTIPLGGGGYTVNLYGANLGDASAVMFGSIPVSSFEIDPNGQTISVKSPIYHVGESHVINEGPLDIVVHFKSGKKVCLKNGIIYMAPIIRKVFPNAGPLSDDYSVTIEGSYLEGVTTLTFGGVSANFKIISSGSKSIEATPSVIPGQVPIGAADVVATSFWGKGTPASGVLKSGFVFMAPVVASVFPGVGPLFGGTQVTIAGQYFPFSFDSDLVEVKFGSEVAQLVSISATKIICTVPHLLFGPGPVDVTVSIAGSHGVSGVLKAGFTFMAPIVTEIYPNVGPAEGGTIVTVGGLYFGNPDATNVFFGDKEAQFTIQPNGPITAQSPRGTAGDIVCVKVSCGEGTGVLEYGFKYTSS